MLTPDEHGRKPRLAQANEQISVLVPDAEPSIEELPASHPSRSIVACERAKHQAAKSVRMAVSMVVEKVTDAPASSPARSGSHQPGRGSTSHITTT